MRGCHPRRGIKEARPLDDQRRRNLATGARVAVRHVGGGLLVTGVDWTGPNSEWERESLTLLAKEVIPMVTAEEKQQLVAAQ